MDGNGFVNNPSPVHYRRRLDRTPDKNFDRLPNNEKVLLSTLRTALEQAKSRIVHLRDENDVKDEVIEEERRLRRAAEERLQNYLVDLYNNPDVNSELRQRLPRAKKHDPLHQDLEDDGDHPRPTNAFTAADDSGGLDSGGRDSGKGFSEETEVIDKMSTGERHDVNKGSLSQPVDTVAMGTGQEPLHSTQQQILQQSQGVQGVETKGGNYQSDQSANSSAVGFTQSPTLAPLTAATISQLLPPYIHPSVFTNPLSSTSMSSLESSSYCGLPSVHGQTAFPAEQELHPNEPVKRMMTENISGRSVPTATLYTSQAAQVNPGTFHSSHIYAAHTSPINRPNTQVPLLQHYIPPPPSYPSQSYGSTSFRAYYGTDNVSHISRLLAEIATLKKENEELKEKLKEAKNDIDLLRIDTNLEEDPHFDKIGAMIEEVHAAEKKRNQAVKMMVDTADEDKAAALGELDRMRMKNARRSGKVSSLSESELTDMEDADDGTGTSNSGSSLNGSTQPRRRRKVRSRQAVEQLVARQREIMKEEMQNVIDQRNEARQRVIKLEKKLSALEHSQFDNSKTDALKAKLRLTERERDIVIAKLRFLSQDVNETKLVYSLHKALLSDDTVNDMTSYPASKSSSPHSDLDIMKNNNNMVAHMSKQSQDRDKLEAKLAAAEKDKKSQAQRIDKLEELVKRQRQKLNTLCAGPMLMDHE